METIVTEFIRLGQLVIGLSYIIVLSLLGFIIADTLGFVAPMPGEEPNKRWLARQQPKAKSESQRVPKAMRVLYLAFIFTYCISGVLLGFALSRLLQ